MIQHPDISMVNELKNLWIECFPGDGDYCELFFREYYTPERCFIIRNSSEIESALYTFDAVTHTINSDISSVYLYAISTSEKYRGRGNAGKLIEYVKKHCAENNINCLYLKAADTIDGFYEKFGFTDNIYINRYICLPTECSSELETEICSFNDFQKMRNQYLLSMDSSVVWTTDTLIFMYKELCSYGYVFKLSVDSNSYYAVVSIPDNMLIIRESDIPHEYYQNLINAVANKLKWDKEIIIHSPDNLEKHLNNILSADRKYNGHSYFLQASREILHHNVYMNLIAE